MAVKINLLDWRTELKTVRQQQFFVMLGAGVALAIGSILVVYFGVSSAIEHQQERNRFLEQRRDEIDVPAAGQRRHQHHDDGDANVQRPRPGILGVECIEFGGDLLEVHSAASSAWPAAGAFWRVRFLNCIWNSLWRRLATSLVLITTSLGSANQREASMFFM